MRERVKCVQQHSESSSPGAQWDVYWVVGTRTGYAHEVFVGSAMGTERRNFLVRAKANAFVAGWNAAVNQEECRP